MCIVVNRLVSAEAHATGLILSLLSVCVPCVCACFEGLVCVCVFVFGFWSFV